MRGGLVQWRQSERERERDWWFVEVVAGATFGKWWWCLDSGTWSIRHSVEWVRARGRPMVVWGDETKCLLRMEGWKVASWRLAADVFRCVRPQCQHYSFLICGHFIKSLCAPICRSCHKNCLYEANHLHLSSRIVYLLECLRRDCLQRHSISFRFLSVHRSGREQPASGSPSVRTACSKICFNGLRWTSSHTWECWGVLNKMATLLKRLRAKQKLVWDTESLRRCFVC